MDLTRKIGVGIVMIIPSFVLSGALWDIFNNYLPVVIWVVIMGFLYRQMVTGKLTGKEQA